MSHTYSSGNNVHYNSACCTVFRTRTVSGNPAYLLREIASGTAHDNVLETAVTACSTADVVNSKWSGLTYSGDNGAASSWIVNNLIKNISGATGLQWGPNGNNTVYTFTASGTTWTKNKA